ncbi:MAG: dihydrofolate reductase [Fidelibacterota bacterium]
MEPAVIIIVAMTKQGVIGKGNALPWHLPEDLRHFKRETAGNTVIMGEKTYLSIGRPLPKRNNIVISPGLGSDDRITVCRDLDSALEKARLTGKKIFIIGGAYTYDKALPYADYLYISHVKKDYEGDVFFPKINFDDWIKESSEEYEDFIFTKYKRR